MGSLRFGCVYEKRRKRRGWENMLMSELERRAQIEEVWARRHVYAESMAEERMAEYSARRDLGRLGCYGFPEPAMVPPRPPVATVRGETVRGGYAVPAFGGRQIAIAHYARKASPDSIAALVTGLKAICGDGHDVYAER
jgi:hypothetical protein